VNVALHPAMRTASTAMGKIFFNIMVSVA